MLIIGHRGAAGLAPENTLAAIRKAMEHGVDEIEIDLRTTRDHMVVIAHDKHLTTPDGQQLTISDHTFAELRSHKADLTTLEEVLATVAGQVPLYLEVKAESDPTTIIKLLREKFAAGLAPSSVRLASFTYRLLKEFHAGLPKVEIIVLDGWSGVRAARHARKLGTKRIIIDQRWLWRGFIRSMARRGYLLGTYTLNDSRKARRWQRYGLHCVVTDYPDLFEKRRP